MHVLKSLFKLTVENFVSFHLEEDCSEIYVKFGFFCQFYQSYKKSTCLFNGNKNYIHTPPGLVYWNYIHMFYETPWGPVSLAGKK